MRTTMILGLAVAGVAVAGVALALTGGSAQAAAAGPTLALTSGSTSLTLSISGANGVPRLTTYCVTGGTVTSQGSFPTSGLQINSPRAGCVAISAVGGTQGIYTAVVNWTDSSGVSQITAITIQVVA